MTALVESCLRKIQAIAVAQPGKNIVAFSGGVDSSLVAALVHRVAPASSLACTGISASLPEAQLDLARHVAEHIGIQMREVPTSEGSHPEYLANEGMACYHCKSELYTALGAVARFASGVGTGGPATPVVLYNGTNADDQRDPTRVGLRAAEHFQVASPVSHLSKDEVRQAAKHLGLPNWNHAASPCLRSRLALGVSATDETLRRIESAERFVRSIVPFDVHHNLRVRLLAKQKAVVEVDSEKLELTEGLFDDTKRTELLSLGFAKVEFRAFRSGSVSIPSAGS
uniref:Asparagine synthetase domain-containing protein n=1 Tax=Rhizochromulina marina TaxID=1034831 RepID=A0A7S2W2R2_9STRA